MKHALPSSLDPQPRLTVYLRGSSIYSMTFRPTAMMRSRSIARRQMVTVLHATLLLRRPGSCRYRANAVVDASKAVYATTRESECVKLVEDLRCQMLRRKPRNFGEVLHPIGAANATLHGGAEFNC